MLILDVRNGRDVYLMGDFPPVRIHLVRTEKSQARLSFDCDKSVSIVRGELLRNKPDMNKPGVTERLCRLLNVSNAEELEYKIKDLNIRGNAAIEEMEDAAQALNLPKGVSVCDGIADLKKLTNADRVQNILNRQEVELADMRNRIRVLEEQERAEKRRSFIAGVAWGRNAKNLNNSKMAAANEFVRSSG